MNRPPIYAFVGLAVMGVSEILMLFHVEPFWSWHTPIAWTGYILFVDGVVLARRGSSWLTRSRREFFFLAVMSVPLWLIFEAYNRLIHNWHYINLPVNTFWRLFGFAWSFSTIWPAIFETAELVATFRVGRDASVIQAERNPERRRDRLRSAAWVSIVVGAIMLFWPVVQPSPYLAAPVWLGFIFLLDPLNARLGAEAISADATNVRRHRIVNLGIGGVICGLVWEFWNYWCRTKWIYTVPIMPNLKIFEMPLPGYLGFPAFALECFTMYVTVRWCFWRDRARPIAL